MRKDRKTNHDDQGHKRDIEFSISSELLMLLLNRNVRAQNNIDRNKLEDKM